MTRRFQALVTILVGATIAGIGLTWSVTAACCSGMPTLVSYLFAGFGLALLFLGIWAYRSRVERPGIVRRNPLYTAFVAIALATALLAHEVYGVRRERVFPMVWQQASAYFGESNPLAPDVVVLSYESHPDTFHLVDDADLASYLRALPDRRVEATVELVYVFGSLRMVRLVHVGELSRPQGFGVTSGIRGSGESSGASTPWD